MKKHRTNEKEIFRDFGKIIKKFWRTEKFSAIKKYLKKLGTFFEILYNFQGILKKLKGIWRKCAIILKTESDFTKSSFPYGVKLDNIWDKMIPYPIKLGEKS